MTRTCELIDCDRPYLAKGMCSPCYHRAHKAQKAKLQCSLAGCVASVHQKGMCQSHYHRQYTHGDPLAGGQEVNSLIPWLESTVADCLAKSVTECVVHNFGPDGAGYCTVTYQGRRTRMHVIAIYLSGRGWVPKGMHSRHLCGNHGCVNPNHLAIGTPRENYADRIVHGTEIAGERHPRSLLTEDAVREIRSSSESQKNLAERFGVSQSQISTVRSRKAWKHVQ